MDEDRVTWWNGGKQIALDTARGLIFLHGINVIHSDLKSQNILLTAVSPFSHLEALRGRQEARCQFLESPTLGQSHRLLDSRQKYPGQRT